MTGQFSEEQRASTIARFEKHRSVWDGNAVLRSLYTEWYGRIAAALPPSSVGPRVEIGSGPGFARQFIPDLELTDLVQAPWHDRALDAHELPYADASLGGLVLLDVLHHLPRPRRFFAEATRVLRPGGRLVMCEPYIGPLSYWAYKFFHVESLRMWGDPLADQTGKGPRDPFDSNQAIPTLIFGRRRRQFENEFPALQVRRVEYLVGLSYLASGGFSRRAILPMKWWLKLKRLEEGLPRMVQRWLAMRMLITIERQ